MQFVALLGLLQTDRTVRLRRHRLQIGPIRVVLDARRLILSYTLQRVLNCLITERIHGRYEKV